MTTGVPMAKMIPEVISMHSDLNTYFKTGRAATWLAFTLIAVIACAGCAGMHHAAGLDTVIAQGAQVECIADGFTFTEGPACAPDGSVYFTDSHKRRIHRWNPDGSVATVSENSNGTIGLFIGGDSVLYACTAGTRAISTVSGEGVITPIVSTYEGAPLNCPNDCWIDPSGAVWFTDPYEKYWHGKPAEQSANGVYRLSPDHATLTRVADNMGFPNGIACSLDGTFLYVVDGKASTTWRWAIRPDGTTVDRTVFASEGRDGMTVDARGVVYITTITGVAVYSGSGQKIGDIVTPQTPSNVTIGGGFLYITARSGLYRIALRTPRR